MSSDRHWERWGEQDPYYAVLTQPRFRADQLDSDSRQAFFEEGRMHVQHVLARLQSVAPDAVVRRVLDFGCGVGRVAIPFAECSHVEEVIAVDIAPAMLREAQANTPASCSGKLGFAMSDDTLSQIDGQFDLVHSCIVLQHIEAGRGMQLFTRLINRIRPGGFGAIHLHYGKAGLTRSLGRESVLRRWLVHRVAAALELARRGIGRLTNRRRPPDPVMEMNPYDLNAIVFLLQSAGVSRFEAEMTDHGGAWGLMLYFHMPVVDAPE